MYRVAPTIIHMSRLTNCVAVTVVLDVFVENGLALSGNRKSELAKVETLRNKKHALSG